MAEQQLPFFVYGTLLPSQPNFYLFEDTVVATEAAILTNAQLYAMQFAPMLAESEGGVVKGAVVTISAESYPQILAQIDALEGYNPSAPHTSLYQRVVRMAQLESGGETEAWVYVGLPEQVVGLQLIGDDWVRFSAENAERIEAWWRKQADVEPDGKGDT